MYQVYIQYFTLSVVLDSLPLVLFLRYVGSMHRCNIEPF